MPRLSRSLTLAGTALLAFAALPLEAQAASPTPPAGSPPTGSSPTASTLAASVTDVRTRLPRPAGPYAVGRDTLHLVDPSRPDPWVPEAGARELMVEMYYPARHGTGRPARYTTTEEARLLLEAYDMADAFPPETLGATAVHGRVAARPVHSARGRYPLAVLSSGFGAPRSTLTGLAEDLASRGYVVAAVDHAYESVGTAFPGGRMLTCVACEKVRTGEDRDALVQGRGDDVSFVLDRLTGPRPAWRHAALIDPRRIGMAGHSIGGASAAAAMAGDRRVRAGVNMDGAFGSTAVPAEGLDGRPFLMLGTHDETHIPGGTDNSWDEAWERLNGCKRWLTVAESTHYSFSDLPAFLDQLGLPQPGSGGGQPPLPGSRALEITRAYTAAFFDAHLKGIPQPLLRGPSAGYPEVSFHRP
ncbi:alpha/beta hydrolase family protein [Streptomyces sp. MUM 178J]|uniref:alpha/beta hydrolase family protein n=1 Tax=Streptomyces sp. MUM 178J TaxID=2791991 RepID=UPI001F03E955|nr:alpha/beta hydrolase [Streptomyces sp. MUM 178J]WRQ82989.1 alpha/beta hydrolase [Streptomyces sp. MUM 178J]